MKRSYLCSKIHFFFQFCTCGICCLQASLTNHLSFERELYFVVEHYTFSSSKLLIQDQNFPPFPFRLYTAVRPNMLVDLHTYCTPLYVPPKENHKHETARVYVAQLNATKHTYYYSKCAIYTVQMVNLFLFYLWIKYILLKTFCC